MSSPWRAARRGGEAPGEGSAPPQTLARVSRLAAFPDEDALAAAIGALRAAGMEVRDAFTPYPSQAVEDALGPDRPWVPRAVLAGAVLTSAAAYLLQWWISLYALPVDVGGRPMHAAPAFVPLSWEALVFGGVTTAFVATWWACRLPRLAHPVHAVEAFREATAGTFFLAVEGPEGAVEDALRAAGAAAIHPLDDEGEEGGG